MTDLLNCPFCGGDAGKVFFLKGHTPASIGDTQHSETCPLAFSWSGFYRPTPEEAITAWNARASDAEITRLTEALRAAEERENALRGIVNSFIGLVISSGLTEDLVAQVFPDMKRKNGQPASTFAKNARRMVNEARQTLAGAKP